MSVIDLNQPDDENNLEIYDAKIYLSILHLLTTIQTTSIDTLSNIFDDLGQFIQQNSRLRYTNINNVLSLLLLYSSPALMPLECVAHMAKVLANPIYSTTNEFNDLEEDSNRFIAKTNSLKNPILASGVQPVIKKTAHDMLVDNQFKNLLFKFDTQNTNDANEILYRFTVSKTIWLSQYFQDISHFGPLFDLVRGYEPFEKWYTQIIKPYIYYWNHHGSLEVKSGINFSDFINIEDFGSKFNCLIHPLNEKKKFGHISTKNWMENVILPIIMLYDSNFQPLIEWLFDESKHSNKVPSEKYQLWHDTINSITHFTNQSGTFFSVESYKKLVKYFLASCYYYAIKHEDSSNVSSIEMLRVYDIIRDTSNTLLTTYGQGELITAFNFELLDPNDSLSNLVDNVNFQPLIEPTPAAITTLKDTIETCEKLYSINKLTILDYLTLRYSNNLDYSTKEKEVTRIMHGLNETNYHQLLSSARLFTKAFISIDPQHEVQMNKLILEKFLFFNLFDIIESFYRLNEFNLSVNTYFQLVNKKFWDCVNQATNLNEKIGKLYHATQCTKLFETFSADRNLDEENRQSIIKIKHLLKAIKNMKNFKIFIEKGKPFTPSDLINKFGIVSSTDDLGDLKYHSLNLIMIILENNPKSYLAFEKLYKILIDLLIFFENDDDQNEDLTSSYLLELKCACIESALIDDNFDFSYKQSIELFEFYSNSSSKPNFDLNDKWLTFYQVGKYVSPEWFNELNDSINNEKIDTLIKQRKILSLILKLIRPNESSIDNSKLILSQWNTINDEIENWYTQLQTNPQSTTRATNDISDNMKNLTNDLISDATNTTNQASEKISNLFVSGLGWAIGANNS